MKETGEIIDKNLSYLAFAYQDDPDFLSELRNRLNRIEELSKLKDFQNHPCTKMMRENALKQIRFISHKLAFSENLDEETRRQLFADRRAHLMYLKWVSVDYDKEMDAIARSLSEKVAENKASINGG